MKATATTYGNHLHLNRTMKKKGPSTLHEFPIEWSPGTSPRANKQKLLPAPEIIRGLRVAVTKAGPEKGGGSCYFWNKMSTAVIVEGLLISFYRFNVITFPCLCFPIGAITPRKVLRVVARGFHRNFNPSLSLSFISFVVVVGGGGVRGERV